MNHGDPLLWLFIGLCGGLLFRHIMDAIVDQRSFNKRLREMKERRNIEWTQFAEGLAQFVADWQHRRAKSLSGKTERPRVQ